MKELFNTPLFGIVLSVAAFEVGLFLNKKLKTPVANPLAIAVFLIIAFLQISGIPLESYQRGGDVIAIFLAPATAVLAISIYGQLERLKRHCLPILVGCTVGSCASIFSVIVLCRLFGLDETLTASLIPKSVTTPIAIGIAAESGGIPAVTVAAVIFTGILGAILSPLLCRVFRVKDPMARGLAIGTSSHAIGTSKALEMGEIEGAMSGLAIGIAGIATVILCLFL
ncbi:LrgB family protein [Acidaminobacterium chupaoyuni]